MLFERKSIHTQIFDIGFVEYDDGYIKLVDNPSQLNFLRCSDKCIRICGHFHY